MSYLPSYCFAAAMPLVTVDLVYRGTHRITPLPKILLLNCVVYIFVVYMSVSVSQNKPIRAPSKKTVCVYLIKRFCRDDWMKHGLDQKGLVEPCWTSRCLSNDVNKKANFSSGKCRKDKKTHERHFR